MIRFTMGGSCGVESIVLDGQMNFSLKVTSGPGLGKHFVLKKDSPLKFGRQDSNDFVLIGDSGISRHHFEITIDNGKFRIRDLNSRNGTYLNRQSVLSSELTSGDEIRAGNTTLLVSIDGPDSKQQAIRESGLEPKSKVEFRFGSDDTTVANINLRHTKLKRQQLFSQDFDAIYFDLPGKFLLLNSIGVRSSIDRELDFETVGQQAVLVFPQTIETMALLREEYYGQDSMIIMNHCCRRTKLVTMINDSFSKFERPTTLVEQITALPSEAVTGLMNGIDLVVCESGDSDMVDVIHSSLHSNWLKRLTA